MIQSIGADPELFFVDDKGVFHSAIPLIAGSKEEPLLIREDGCAIQHDNVAAEFNIPPCKTLSAFIESISFNLNTLAEIAKKQGLSISSDVAAIFEKDQLADRRARVFGCDPDYNAWTLDVNPRPKSQEKGLRSAGGHVHVGLPLSVSKEDFIRCMDVSLGLWSITVDPDKRRRELYGKAGAFRYKDYGVEYRTLSGFWIHDEVLVKEVYERTNDTSRLLERIEEINKDGSDIQAAINESNKSLASRLGAKYGFI